jgi:hypothetical protein
MIKNVFLVIVFLGSIISACSFNDDNYSENTDTSSQLLDDDFNRFLEEFSADFQFQLNRIKFPLKTTTFDSELNKEFVVLQSKSKFKQLDFRIVNSNSKFDNWTQNRVVDKLKNSAEVQIRGVDNGIYIDYSFKKINNTWMLIEITDAST